MRHGRSLVAGILLAAVMAGCSPRLESADPQERKAALRAVRDEAILASVAVRDSDAEVRRAAVDRLDLRSPPAQSSLARVVIEFDDPRIRGWALRTLVDQPLLARVAVECDDEDDRIPYVIRAGTLDEDLLEQVANIAIHGITDERLLEELARTGSPRSVASEASFRLWGLRQGNPIGLPFDDDISAVALGLGKHRAMPGGRISRKALDRERSLADKVLRRPGEVWSRSAVHRMTDRKLLGHIALEAADPFVRECALLKLGDPSFLAALAWGDRNPEVRVLATLLLEDPGGSKRLATSPRAAVRAAAVSGIGDDGCLLKLLRGESSAKVRLAIVRALRQPSSLQEVAATDFYQSTRDAAVARIREPAAAARARAEQARIRLRAADVEQHAVATELVKQALEGPFDVVRVAAVGRLRAPADLESVAAASTDRDVSKIALGKLLDGASLRRVAAAAHDPATKMVARLKCGELTWAQVFSRGADPTADLHRIGEAMAAVTLFPSVPDEARAAARSASLDLIRAGDESWIPDMIDLLDRYGDRDLAYDYLNSGQPDLENAARVWGALRGLHVTTIYGGGIRARWGQR
ncbi:MAG: hypothetical protein V1907_01235 [Candidatus Kerfeldbacteria bacterium]